MVNDLAYFDALYIARQLQTSLGNVSQAEVHLFSYLGCLLSLYRGRPVSEWGYGFISTKDGAPFSAEISEAFNVLELVHLSKNGEFFSLSQDGETEYSLLRELSRYSERTEFLDGACSSTLSLPVGMVREALSLEPGLNQAGAVKSVRPLLAGPGLDALYEQFRTLSGAVGVNAEDLMVPAVVWLTFLAQVANESPSSVEGGAA